MVSSHKGGRELGKVASFSGRLTYSSFHVTALLNGMLLGMPSYLVRGGATNSWKGISLWHGSR